jgi:hypothetical protein
VKSAIVHTVRYAREIAHGTPESRRALLVEKLTGDLNRARRVWRRPPLHRDDVGRALARWV